MLNSTTMFLIQIDPIRVLNAANTVVKSIVRNNTHIRETGKYGQYRVDDRETYEAILADMDLLQTLWENTIRDYEITHRAKLEVGKMFSDSEQLPGISF